MGSNLGDRATNLEKARMLIDEFIGKIHKASSIYESEPWGYEDSNSYYNQVICIQTKIEPQVLLKECLLIEDKLDRVRTKNSYEARTIDIDILFYDMLIINSKELILPHPRISQRKFVLQPLCEIAPSLKHPISKKTVNAYLNECTDTCWVKKQ